jgi:hypothetical protein
LLAECYMLSYLEVITPSAKLKAILELRACYVGLASLSIRDSIE